MIAPYKGKAPQVDPSAFVAENATVIGQVSVGAESSIWFGAVVRGDIHWIRLGSRTNIQDGCILHVTQELYPLDIGSEVTVGHGAVVRGSHIGNDVSIGMNSTIMSHSRIGDHCLVGANTFVPYHEKYPERSLITGLPGKVVRRLEGDMLRANQIAVDIYMDLIPRYRSGTIWISA